MTRCQWAERSPALLYYHDTCWGIPVFDEKKLFQVLSLEVFQAGLSWETVLKFEPALTKIMLLDDYPKLAQVSQSTVKNWLRDDRIIRNAAKVQAVINNAKQLQNSQQNLFEITWKPTNRTVIDHFIDEPILSSDYYDFVIPYVQALKKIGFKRMGPVTVYSYLQAVGVVNDHFIYCDYKYN
ncbi:DNA-3-methyladenine glycosylase I [Lentilactobacillus kribbianus]|uniref:DNA-3-methyladenine glycosylase I n=1 Tax=Lentilactobacillus kribbianus TaxID=2729622 RepID=UPI0015542754|nr:DNA-3-methyladenine glycosylase I [Lentilactobacillus kribbianus]